MLVTVYTEACYRANGHSDTDITVEIDLADFTDVPTSAEIHALLPDTLLSRLGVAVDADSDITIVEGTDPQWEWFEDEDPSNWTITQAWEFDQEVERVGSSLMEEFGIFVTNYWNVRRQGATGILDTFHDAYCGTYEDGEAYAQEIYVETRDEPVDLSSWPFTCIDWEAAWNELEMSGDNTGYENRNGQLVIFNGSF